jgi:hypothetical protein
MHEQFPLTNETTEAFLNAEGRLYDLVEEDAFSQRCLQKGLDPTTSVTDARYWEIVEDMVYDKLKEGEAKGESDLELAALQITAGTPLFLQAESLLKNHTPMSSHERHGLRERVSYFNSLIRYVGSTYPEVRASEISAAMVGAAEIAGMSGQETSHQIRNTIRGAQHELAFGQLLAAGGTEYRGATTEEDLHGIDYVVNVGNKTLLVDVKASLSEVEALGGSRGPFAVRWSQRRNQPNVTVMYSLAKDSELGDSFYLADELAAERALKLNEFLEQASRLSRAA